MDEAKVLDQPLINAQEDLNMLDTVKGLEAYAKMVGILVGRAYPEYPEVSEEELEALEKENKDLEPLDNFHHFLRETERFAMGARQQLEQRLFGGKDA